MKWKSRIISGVFMSFLYVSIALIFDYFFDETSYSLNILIFKGLFFGIFMGIGFPYITEKFRIHYYSENRKKH